MRNILILGFGARENAIKEHLKPNIVHRLDTEDFSGIKQFCIDYNIDLVIPSTEAYLCNGVVDYLQTELPTVEVFGPTKHQAKVEGSKFFSKSLMKELNIPTAEFLFYKNKEVILKYLENFFLYLSPKQMVIKYSGLAKGKGVYLPESHKEALDAFNNLYENNKHNWEGILIEERLEGPEVSVLAFCDGTQGHLMPQAQDYKRIYDNDKGPNTGGMGAYSPSRLENKELEKKIIDKIIEPTLKGLKDLKTEFKGFLYAGLIIINNEPFLIEYNVRMGDPECQTILPKLKTDLFEILVSCCEENLANVEIEWSNEKSLCIVLCSKGYPESYKNEVLIDGLEKIKTPNGDFLYHAGTKRIKNKVYSNGGRVLNFVSLSNNFEESRNKSISLIKNLNWENGFFRKDIGYKVID